MNEKPDWELVDDDPQPKQRFNQQGFSRKDFLFAMLGKYPRLKLVGLATMGVVLASLVALFSLIAVTGATVASALFLFVAWCKGKFFKNTKAYQVHPFGK